MRTPSLIRRIVPCAASAIICFAIGAPASAQQRPVARPAPTTPDAKPLLADVAKMVEEQRRTRSVAGKARPE